MSLTKLLGISGSPREGATAFVVREALEFAASLANQMIPVSGREAARAGSNLGGTVWSHDKRARCRSN